MDFKEAESKYFELKGRLEAGALTLEQFQAEVGQVRVQDDQGRYWAIDAPGGGWLCYDGANWVSAQPPAGVATLAPPAPAAAPRRGGRSVPLIGAVAVAVLMCLVALCGGGLILTRSGGGAGAGEEADVISQEEAEGIADDIITEEFSDLEGAGRIIGSYENPAGTEFWTVTYRREVETQVEGEKYSIPRVVIVSVDKETGETVVAVSN